MEVDPPGLDQAPDNLPAGDEPPAAASPPASPTPPVQPQSMVNMVQDGAPPVRYKHLNFQVEPKTYKEFRKIAADREMGMRELFLEALEAWKKLNDWKE